MDNQTAVAYVNKMGSTHSPALMHQACELWQWCLLRGITLSAEYLPGSQNKVADEESRAVWTSAEWRLNPDVFLMIQKFLGPCAVDLFATRFNHQLPRYVSWRPDPFAMATDAFSLHWQGLQAYAFPPFALLGKCIQKIREEGSMVVLIAPHWQAQTWFPALLELLVEDPLLLPRIWNLLTDPSNNIHPLAGQGKLQLVTWKVSGDGTLRQAYLNKLQTYWLQVGARVPTPPMNQAGDAGYAGVIQGIWIPFHVGSSLS